MSIVVGSNWRRLVPNALELTDDELNDIASTPSGRRALEADRLEATTAANTARSLTLRDSETGQAITAFTSPGQRERAYANPLYSSSKAYRDAVMAAEANSQLAPSMQAGSLRGRPVGVDANSMLEGAKRDAARAHVSKLFQEANGNSPDAALARMRIMELLTSDDPAIKDMVSYAEEVHGQGDSQIVREMKENKAAGHGTRIQVGSTEEASDASGLTAGNPRDIDYSTGLYRDGSTPPSNSNPAAQD